MNKRIFFATFFFGLSFSVWLSAQTGPRVKYWITFKDKTGTPYSLSNPSAFLSQKSITRRTMYNIPYHSSDLPVNPSYIKQVDTTRYV
ncbi:MAG: hypothetical protein IT236_06795, partial [Bacteroidia bacterium]|nr:hypothetical protein [Bacteroidia bacterium]